MDQHAASGTDQYTRGIAEFVAGLARARRSFDPTAAGKSVLGPDFQASFGSSAA